MQYLHLFSCVKLASATKHIYMLLNLQLFIVANKNILHNYSMRVE